MEVGYKTSLVQRFRTCLHFRRQRAHRRQFLVRRIGIGHQGCGPARFVFHPIANHLEAVYVGRPDVGDDDLRCDLANQHQAVKSTLRRFHCRARNRLLDQRRQQRKVQGVVVRDNHR